MRWDTSTWDESVGGDAAAGPHLTHWAHHGLVALADGRLLTPAPDHGLLVLDPDGTPIGSIPTATNEIHGMTVSSDGAGGELVWLADCGFTMERKDDGNYAPAGRDSLVGPRAVCIDLDGNELVSIGKPDHPAYESALYLPTHVAVDDAALGGSGDVWVADGYGASLVHRYRLDGGEATYLATIDGSTGAGGFDTPHNLFVDRRGDQPELLVSDRGNAQVQVFDMEGEFIRCFGAGELTSPSAFATIGELLVIAELNARLVVVDRDDRIVQILGSGEEALERPGWPNALDGENKLTRPDVHREKFNSPHGLTVDARGRLLVSEWLIGGRLVAIDQA